MKSKLLSLMLIGLLAFSFVACKSDSDSDSTTTTATTSSISGKVTQEAVQGETVFADKDGDAILDSGETSAVTDASGDFNLNLAADYGSYTLVTVGTGSMESGRTVMPMKSDSAGNISPLTTLAAGNPTFKASFPDWNTPINDADPIYILLAQSIETAFSSLAGSVDYDDFVTSFSEALQGKELTAESIAAGAADGVDAAIEKEAAKSNSRISDKEALKTSTKEGITSVIKVITDSSADTNFSESTIASDIKVIQDAADVSADALVYQQYAKVDKFTFTINNAARTESTTSALVSSVEFASNDATADFDLSDNGFSSTLIELAADGSNSPISTIKVGIDTTNDVSDSSVDVEGLIVTLKVDDLNSNREFTVSCPITTFTLNADATVTIVPGSTLSFTAVNAAKEALTVSSVSNDSVITRSVNDTGIEFSITDLTTKMIDAYKELLGKGGTDGIFAAGKYEITFTPNQTTIGLKAYTGTLTITD